MIEIQPVRFEDKSVLRRLMELYLYDFSEFDDADVNEHGLYEYEYFDNYWTETTRHPFFIRCGGNLAGFAMVRITRENGDLLVFNMAEFFVLRKYRRLKVGQRAAVQLFDRFPGPWHVAQEERNRPAQSFWRATIADYTQGQFQEIQVEGWHGPVQAFESGKQ